MLVFVLVLVLVLMLLLEKLSSILEPNGVGISTVLRFNGIGLTPARCDDISKKRYKIKAIFKTVVNIESNVANMDVFGRKRHSE